MNVLGLISQLIIIETLRLTHTICRKKWFDDNVDDETT